MSNKTTQGERRISRTGFSMLELALVIVIISIVAAIAIPRYANAISHYRADMAARRIAADLLLAQNNAQISSTSRTVTFSTVSNQYTIPAMDDLDSPPTSYVIKLGDDPYKATLVSASFGDDSSVIFDGYGVPDNGGQVVVQAGHFSKTVVLNADTGRAAVQ